MYIRLIPTLTSLKLMATEIPEQHSGTSEALLVGDPYVGSVRIKTKRLHQLPSAKAEVEMIGNILQTEPLIGEAARKRSLEQTRLGCFSTHCRPWKSRNGRDCFLPKS